MKDTYYFPHDTNAHKDPKCSALINDFGVAGYGLYRALIEIMHEQGGKIKKFPKLFDGLSFQLQIEKEALLKQIEAMLREYELFVEDENYIRSDRVLRNLQEREEKYKAKQEAGRLGGLQSGISRNSGSKTKQNEAVLEANEQKERKGNENKEKEIIENNHSKQERIQKMNAVDKKGGQLVKVRNEITGHNDLMDKKTKESFMNFIYDVDQEDFKNRVLIFQRCVEMINNLKLEKFLFQNITTYTIGNFLANINMFNHTPEFVFNTITEKDYKTKVLRMIKPKGITTEDVEDIVTETPLPMNAENLKKSLQQLKDNLTGKKV